MIFFKLNNYVYFLLYIPIKKDFNNLIINFLSKIIYDFYKIREMSSVSRFLNIFTIIRSKNSRTRLLMNCVEKVWWYKVNIRQ